jgi:peptidyl-prolyl cis-trans isomerase C
LNKSTDFHSKLSKLKMKTNTIIGLFGALALAATSSTFAVPAATNSPAATRADKLFDDPAIVRGKDFEIKRSQLDEAFINAKAAAAGAGVTFTEAERGLLEVRLMNELIVGKILAAKGTDADQQRAREAAEKFIANARKQSSTEEAFNAKLKLSKLTLEELRAKLIKEALPQVVLEREIKSQVTVTDAQVKNFYDDNPAKFEEPETVHAMHLLIATRDTTTGAELSPDQKAAKRKQIEDLLKRAQAGEDFGKLARQYSEFPDSRDSGGEFTLPRGQMPPSFEAAAFALKKDEISPVVTTDYGYHIIKLIGKNPARTVPFAETSAKIKDYLISQEGAKLAPAYFEKLKKEAGVEILDEDLKAADKQAAAAAATAASAKTK